MPSVIMDPHQRPLTAKDLMKTAKPEKPVREPRLDCRQTNYSAAALAMMEQATGMRFAKAPVPLKPPVQAVDAA